MTEPTGARDRLRAELAALRRRVEEMERALQRPETEGGQDGTERRVVEVPEELEETFRTAQDYVRKYFSRWEQDPTRARIEFSGERYILIRAASMSTEFFDLVSSLYRDRGPRNARLAAHGFLFDVAHALGKADAASFHERMGVTDPVEKLSAGPVHFAYAGWARVSILPESTPSPDEDYFLTYDHPDSFEAEAWLESGKKPDFPVCVMNAGYSSGWCEESFGIPLVAAEVTCMAMGDQSCRFVMAPPSRIQEHLEAIQPRGEARGWSGWGRLEVPEVFRCKRLEDELARARDELEQRVEKRTIEVERRNVELRLANERLEDLQRARAEFVATMSHELRTPLVTGLGYVEMLLEGSLGPLSEEGRAGMGVAQRNLQRLAVLVDDILSYHRLTGRDEGAKPQLSAFDIGWLCRECCEGFLVRSGRGGEKPAVSVPEGLPPVVADEGMVRRVLANLLDNAGRHAGAGARIWVAVERMEGEVRVSVNDDGKGMPPDALSVPVDPFLGPDSSGRSLGLGLSIVSRLLAAHGSELDLASEEGRGTTASFVLPLGPAGIETAHPAARPHPEPPGLQPGGPAGRRILVLEDDEDTADFVELALSSEGYRVSKAPSAEEALAALERETVDLMLVDFTLPGMSGVEFCRRVKGEAGTSRIPLYMFTARAEPARRAEATEAGCDGYLVKPISVNTLLERVKEALSAAD